MKSHRFTGNELASAKANYITRIVENPTYLPGSKLMGELRRSLEKLSLNTLAQLATVIACKSLARKANFKCAKCGYETDIGGLETCPKCSN